MNWDQNHKYSKCISFASRNKYRLIIQTHWKCTLCQANVCWNKYQTCKRAQKLLNLSPLLCPCPLSGLGYLWTLNAASFNSSKRCFPYKRFKGRNAWPYCKWRKMFSEAAMENPSIISIQFCFMKRSTENLAWLGSPEPFRSAALQCSHTFSLSVSIQGCINIELGAGQRNTIKIRLIDWWHHSHGLINTNKEF